MTQPPPIPPPNPPDPVPLNYETPGPIAITSTRQAAWIALLINGILALLCGGCTATIFGFAGFVIFSISKPGAAASGSGIALFFIVLICLIPFALGTTSIVCSIKIRKGSRPATITALIITILQFLTLAVFTIPLIFTAISEHDPEPLLSAAMFAAGAVLQAVLVWLLIRTLREPRPTMSNELLAVTPPQSPHPQANP